MKKFTCKEMGGPCEEVHRGATAMEIAKQNFAHIMATTDNAHKQMREQMTKTRQGAKQGRVVGAVQQRMGQERGRGLIVWRSSNVGQPNPRHLCRRLINSCLKNYTSKRISAPRERSRLIRFLGPSISSSVL